MTNRYRILPLLIILIIGVSINIFYVKKDVVIDDTVSKIISDKVFNYLDRELFFLDRPSDFNDFYLLFDDYKLSTKNFINVFQHFRDDQLIVKRIYPYINPMYENYLNDYIGEIIFINEDLKSGLNSKLEKYISILDNYGLDDEINKVNVFGVNIRVVLINTSNKSMYNFLINNPNIKFSMMLDGPFYKIK